MTTVLEYLKAWIQMAEEKPPLFTWDADSTRYRNKDTGRYYAESRILALADGYTENVNTRLTDLTERFINGDMELGNWQRQVARILKDGYIINAAIGRGGINQLDNADYGRIGGHLRFEYRHLNDFAQAIKDGKLTPAQIQMRIRMYADGVRTAYFDGLQAAKKAAGYTWKRKVLNPAEHCQDCKDQAGLGWVPINDQKVTPPGVGTACGHNCKCDMDFGKDEDIG